MEKSSQRVAIKTRKSHVKARIEGIFPSIIVRVPLKVEKQCIKDS